MPDHALAGGSEVLDRIGHEGQRAAAEGVADEVWRQVQDAVPEAGAGCGGAVVRLVGMQDVQTRRAPRYRNVCTPAVVIPIA